jgi:4-amino-4-deoxy-L-arabinose transferase-like glycosyltransferase
MSWMHRGWVSLCAPALAALILAACLAQATSLFDRDEPRFATAALEMAARSEWLVPTFRGELRPDKPVLAYWLMEASMRIFGASAWAARLPSVCAFALACFALAWLGRRWFSAKVGSTAAWLLALSPLAMAEASLATVDALLLLFTLLATAFGIELAMRGRGKSTTTLLGLCLGLALLTKGPVGLALPALSAWTTRWMLPVASRRPGFALRWSAAQLLAIAFFLAWAIPANLATDGEFARMGLGKHVAERVASPMEGHGGAWLLSLPYYIPVLVLGFFPWSACLPAAWSWLRSEAHGEQRAKLIGWSVPTLLFMTIVATKLPHYVLPAWPGLCLLIAGWLHADSGPSRSRGARAAAWISAVCCALLAAGLLFLPSVLKAPAMSISCEIGSLLCVLLIGVSWRALRRAEWSKAMKRSGAVAAALWLWIAWTVLPAMERETLAPRMANMLRELPQDLPTATWRCREPSLDFAAFPRLITDLETHTELKAWIRAHPQGLLLLPDHEVSYVDLPTSARAVQAVEGFLLPKGRRMRVEAWQF